MSRKAPEVLPYSRNDTTSVEDPSGDIAAFRAFKPSTATLEPALDAQYRNEERRVADQYGAYSGIPSAVARNRLENLARNELMASKATAMAQGNAEAEKMRMSQLGALADLTATRRQQGSGFNSQAAQGSGVGNSLISGGSAIAGAAIIA
jgi:hypothetical protein